MTKFKEGDLVWHKEKVAGEVYSGHVVGFGPDPRWVRVKTTDGRIRLWLDEHLLNVSRILPAWAAQQTPGA